jgi:hypothetical protein
MSTMDEDLRQDVLKRLKDDFALKVSNDGRWLQEGKCPGCSKKELFGSALSPWLVKCGRKNKCGWEGFVKDLYNDLFQSWSDRYQSTEASPNAAADAYLVNARGFEIARLKGAYRQEWYHDSDLKIGTATVRFEIDGGGRWERLIDRPSRFGRKKARMLPGTSYRGHAWIPPVTLIDISAVDELWIVEGIFDAIALCLAGIPAIAAMSCNNYPNATLERIYADAAKRPKLVWAFDGDHAGTEYIQRWHARARQDGWRSGAAVIPLANEDRKIDWNEAYQRFRLEASHLDEYRHEGALVIAESVADKARLIYKHRAYKSFPIEFGEQLYWFALNEARYDKAWNALADKADEMTEEERRDEALKQAGAIESISTCHPVPLYFQRNSVTDDSHYFFRITAPHQKTVKAAFKPDHIATPAQFDVRLLSIMAGASWTGSKDQLTRMYGRRLMRLKHVEAIDFIGYSKEHGAYVFGDVAIKDGRVVEINDEDYFEIDRKTNVKTTSSIEHRISHVAAEFNQDWPALLFDVYGTKGMAALVFWFASLFAEQIRAKQESFPFFEMVGEGGSGKTSLVMFLNRLLGRPTAEGFDPAKSTAAGRARTFVQVANMPVVLMEGDRDTNSAKTSRFDFDELKSLYNGRSTRTTGVKSSGNETYEPPFRGSIVIEQNRPVKADDAVMQRICHVFMTREGHTDEGKRKSDVLNAMTTDELSYFVVASARAEVQIMERFAERMPVYERMFMDHEHVKSVRLAKNHAQLMAMAEALEVVLPQVEKYRSQMIERFMTMTVERQKTIGADHPVVQDFWERYHELNGGGQRPFLNHSSDDQVIAVNILEWMEMARQRWSDIPTLAELREHLPTSKKYPFIEASRTVHSAIRMNGPPSVRCWIFKKKSDQ